MPSNIYIVLDVFCAKTRFYALLFILTPDTETAARKCQTHGYVHMIKIGHHGKPNVRAVLAETKSNRKWVQWVQAEELKPDRNQNVQPTVETAHQIRSVLSRNRIQQANIVTHESAQRTLPVKLTTQHISEKTTHVPDPPLRRPTSDQNRDLR